MKKLFDVKVQIGIAVVCMTLAYVDALMNHAESWKDLSFIGKTFTGIAMLVLAYQVVLIIIAIVKKVRD